MNEAPEGLNYGNQHREGERNKLESELEKGKYDSARSAHYGQECDSAESLRMAGSGSHDPMYGSNRKNK